MKRSGYNCIQLFLLALLLASGCIANQNIYSGVINAKLIWLFSTAGLILFSLSFFPFARKAFYFNALDVCVFSWFFYVIANYKLHGGEVTNIRAFISIALLIVYFFAKSLTVKPILFILLFLVLAFSQVIIAYLQWIHILPSYHAAFPITGFYFNPGPFAIYLSALLCFCFAIYLFIKAEWLRFLSLALGISGLPLIYTLYSRAAWVGFIFTIVGLFYIRTKRFEKLRNRFSTQSFPFLILAISGAIIITVGLYIYSLKKDSADGRVLVWKITGSMIIDKPLIGYGEGGIETFFLKHQSAYFQKHPERMETEGRLADSVVYVFNDLLQITVEQGFAGLCVFLLMLFLFFKYTIKLYLHKKKNPINSAIDIGVLSIASVLLISGLFSYPLMVLPIKIIFSILLGYVSKRYENLYKEKSVFVVEIITKRLKCISRMMGIACGILFLVYGYTALRYFQLLPINSEEVTKTNRRKLLHAKWILGNEPLLIILQADEYLQNRQTSKAIDFLEQSKLSNSDRRIYYALGQLYTECKEWKKAEQQYLFLYYALPSLLRPKYELALLYYQSGQAKKWKQFSEIVIRYTPKVESVFTTDMKSRISKLVRK